MNKADSGKIERIRCTHKLDEELISSGAFIDRERLRSKLIIAHQERNRLLIEIEQLEAEAAAMREALEEASDAVGELGDQRLAEETGNEDWIGLSARIEAALAPHAGRALLERLRRAERERDDAWVALKAVREIQKATLDMVGKR